jgi:ribosome-associated translation inhibitor RaiA
MDRPTSMFIPSIYKSLSKETMNGTAVVSEEQQKVPDNISNYINSHIERLIKPHFETFDNEDIKPNMLSLIRELQDSVDNTVKKTGDTISGSLHILKVPEANMDAVNKEYVDWLFLTLSEKLETKLSKNSDLNLNHFKIKNIQSPTDLNDAVTKNYVDQKFESMGGYLNQNLNHLFSKGQILTASVKKTFFFNPGFICPQKIHIVSVGFSTSPYKYKIGEKLKYGEKNPTKLYFMVNNEIRSEYIIEKDVQLGHTLKEFDDPIIFEKGDNFMMVVETMIEDASVNISFY